MVVGITGGIGSGKTTIVNMFANFENNAVYIADKEAKMLMHTSKVIQEKIIKEFSEEAYVNGNLNRPFIANIVFNDKAKLKTLNRIVHPEVHKHLQDFVNLHQDKDYIIYENAILFENQSDALCDKIITITAPLKDRLSRVVARDNVSQEEVLSRIHNQWPETKKTLQSHYLIVNKKLSESKNMVLLIHNKLTKK